MIEKVNPSHPDKVADRIAGAIVDLAYKKTENPKIAVEVLIGHGTCLIIAETSVHLEKMEVYEIAGRIVDGSLDIAYKEVPQDAHLAENQSKEIRCGDNGIFKGVAPNVEETLLTLAVRNAYNRWPTDGKFIYDKLTKTFIACQSNAKDEELTTYFEQLLGDDAEKIIINPLGEWTGGTNVDTGATNRKLGSDMGRAVTGGGLHGKDLSKADVSVNIACFLEARKIGADVEALCAIGDDKITFRCEKNNIQSTALYADVVKMAGDYIKELGGFERLAEWGLF